MNLGHQVQQLETKRGEEIIKYFKCIKCGTVIFAEGDDYANTICQKAMQDREDLRKKL